MSPQFWVFVYFIHIVVCVGLPGPQFPVCFHCRESPVLGICILYTHCCVCRSTRSPVPSVFQVNHCESPVLGICIPYTHCCVCRSTRSPFTWNCPRAKKTKTKVIKRLLIDIYCSKQDLLLVSGMIFTF